MSFLITASLTAHKLVSVP